jgi:hypothetical protein
MGICRSVRVYSSHHEWVGNVFSLIGVALLFGTVWATLQYYEEISDWLAIDAVVHTSLLVAALVVDVLLIFAMLAIGSTRAGEEDKNCFATFRGRRSGGGGSPIDAIRNWLLHMENVGKKHR